MTYRGRFAPSPTGPLHAGSLVAALASWLDARAHGGAWLVRIEDIDPPREVPGAAQDILATLARFGMESDEPVLYQSTRTAAYEQAFDRLRVAGWVYGCACSRKEIDDAIAQRPGWPAGVYPGTCRAHPPAPAQVRAWRFAVPTGMVAFTDRHAGRYEQHVAREVGDFVLRRADGLWAYQLAVVVDDAAQGITDVVRGADLLDNTPRQIVLQQALGLPTPSYLHVRVVVNALGEKLSKQTGAAPLDLASPLAELERAAAHLRLPRVGADSVPAFLRAATALWAERRATADTIAAMADDTDIPTLRRILHENRRIAVVGISAEWHRPSYFVGKYLLEHGYTMIPVNPKYSTVLGQPCYPDLAAARAAGPVDMVDCFRKGEDIGPLAQQAVAIGAKCLWLQLGVRNEAAAALARAAGLDVVQDRCVKIEHGRLFGGLNWAGVNTRVISAKRPRQLAY